MKGEKIDFGKVVKRIEGSKFDDGYIVSQILYDVERIGEERATQYLFSFSPSKLGQLGYLGLRKLAVIKRDEPEEFERLIK